MNRKAIVIYVDKSEVNLTEFSWLYKTFILWELYKEYDIVCYCNPVIESKIPVHDNVIIKPKQPLNVPGSKWETYGFVNSFAMFREPEEEAWIRDKYDYILKTDADVFLTENILGYEPDETMIGMGGYMQSNPEEILTRLQRIIKKLNLNNNNLNHVGASVFGLTDSTTTLINNHFALTEYILNVELSNQNPGKWPGWFRGVASMYAIHLAVNHMFSEEHVKLYTLDSLCWANKINKSTIHIHAWHGQYYFSKHEFFKGSYEKLEANKVPKIAGEYCHWIVSNDIEDLIKVKNQSKSLA